MDRLQRILIMEEKFDRVCLELIEKRVGEYETLRDLCREMDTDEMQMNNLFYEKFGVSGEEVFYKFLVYSIVIAV